MRGVQRRARRAHARGRVRQLLAPGRSDRAADLRFVRQRWSCCRARRRSALLRCGVVGRTLRPAAGDGTLSRDAQGDRPRTQVPRPRVTSPSTRVAHESGGTRPARPGRHRRTCAPPSVPPMESRLQPGRVAGPTPRCSGCRCATAAGGRRRKRVSRRTNVIETCGMRSGSVLWRALRRECRIARSSSWMT